MFKVFFFPLYARYEIFHDHFMLVIKRYMRIQFETTRPILFHFNNFPFEYATGRSLIYIVQGKTDSVQKPAE